ncbi:hypothetical protein DFJ58DRAFT_863512 [Suillus subalutaceus]|uniref:uncharacterized protein n=1 Tax=Suillus subalutaceus TaxID=48586 RepID=UPI001B88548E|nr:uncharacterized protein DFJ58DRAFT_863512 [Suillus subalutaceus]KAG1865865.1 hypothetical protein DFJ58DRAFT_863512 [Suillus subalutaceus]
MSTAPTTTWNPSSLLAYDALPNQLDDSDSDVKSATNFYDRSLTSRRCALAGVACTSIASCCCIIAGAVITASGGAATVMSAGRSGVALRKEMLVISLNLIVTLCTESTGFVHNISLRSALDSESRLRFNSNLRLLTAARGWSNPNGALLNGIMVVLLIISYSSVSLVTLTCYVMSLYEKTVLEVDIIGMPLLVLGIALLLQVVIALSGMRAAKILTWSSSSLDLTPALIHHSQLTPVLLRCMRSVSDFDVDGGPARPSETQPSAWHAHPSIRKVINSLWGLVIACAGWGALILFIHNTYESYTGTITWKSWSFFPDDQNFLYSLGYSPELGWGPGPWIMCYINLAIIQGPLTLCLHCSELIANVIRDEGHWRCGTEQKGITPATNPLKSVIANPLCLALFVAKPALHWVFGLCFVLRAFQVGPPGIDNPNDISTAINMYPMQILNLFIVLFVFACFFTLVALRQRRGPQPAAYGHLQTLSNLVDEWTPVMWWGHKEDGIPYCHAGRVLVR